MEEPGRLKPYERPQGERRGLLLVYTGDGKGKSTAAFGLALRAHGRGLKVRIFQFLKHETARFGEHRALGLLGIPIEGLGDGFTWRSRDLARSAGLAQEGWLRAKEALLSGAYDLVILDEATYPLRYGWISLEEFLDTLRARPAHVHVVVTGRGAPEALLHLADTVTEMRKVKHAFDQGVPAQRGIEH
ncbi:cob(I)yrinic acid a,c-diamide adenosyltransferase [Thermus sp. FJN-A]